MLDGLDTSVSESDTIVILPAMAGGAALIRPATPPTADVEPGGRLGRVRPRRASRRCCPPGHPFPDCRRPSAAGRGSPSSEVRILVADDDGELAGFTGVRDQPRPRRRAGGRRGAQLLRAPVGLAPRRRAGADGGALDDLRRAGLRARRRVWSFAANAARQRASTRPRASRATAPSAPRRSGPTCSRCATGARWRSLRGVRIDNLQRVEPFVTLDGSEIREVAGPPSGNAVNQSLAEATVPPGGETVEHFHRDDRGDLLLHARRRPHAPGRRGARGRPGRHRRDRARACATSSGAPAPSRCGCCAAARRPTRTRTRC